MYDNFENLQKKAQKYYLKKRVTKILILSALLLVLLLAYALFEEMLEPKVEIQKPIKVEKIVQKIAPKELKESPVVEPIEPIKQIEPIEIEPLEPEAIAVEPTEKVEEEVEKEERAIHDVDYKLHIDSQSVQKLTKYKKETTQKIVEKEKPKEEIQEAKTSENKKIELEEKSDKPVEIVINRLDSLDKMISFYERESRYSLAIEIAQKYYDMRDYESALLWSKKANMLDKKDYKAWLLYAKSEYAKMNHTKAIEILKLYLQSSSSPQVESQLLTWTKGK